MSGDNGSENSLQQRMPTAAFAFRGYNVTNLGRSAELLAHPVYGPTIEKHLVEASKVCAEATNRKVNLTQRVRNGVNTTLKTYPQAISMIVGVELAQIELLEQHFGIKLADARYAAGYSLGEVSAVIACGVFDMRTALTPLLILSEDVAELAHGVHMGVVFSRGPAIDLEAIEKYCLELTAQGEGVIAISTYLSPNTVLILGQNRTVHHFKRTMHDVLPKPVHMRINSHTWPPMHTPITWQRAISNRAGVMLGEAQGGFIKPNPPILSCVTGDEGYTETNSRELLNKWVDHPQKMWDVIDTLLAQGVETVVHVGPEPNIFPATLRRLSNNIATQLNRRTLAAMGLRAVSRIVRNRPWLTGLMTKDATLLRAPFIEQIVLEDWLLEQEVG